MKAPRDIMTRRGVSPAESVVIGDGWAALGTVAFLRRAGRQVIWISGSGARFEAPLPFLDASTDGGGAAAWQSLLAGFGLPNELETGSFLREFRGKAFREPAWAMAPTPEDRNGVREELLWGSEKVFAPSFEGKFPISLSEAEAKIREMLTADEGVRRIEGIPVKAMAVTAGRVTALTLASGEEVSCSDVFYADRWRNAGRIEGMPKRIPSTQKRGEMGVLQAVFAHERGDTAPSEAFFSALQNPPGSNEPVRHVWGYFCCEGKGVWTVFLSPEEAEDNVEIGKKLKRMKSAVQKMFAGTAWELKEASKEAQSEQMRLEESVAFSEGEVPHAPLAVSDISNLVFLTDGYGPAPALCQAQAAVSAPAERPAQMHESV